MDLVLLIPPDLLLHQAAAGVAAAAAGGLVGERCRRVRRTTWRPSTTPVAEVGVGG